MLAHRSSVAPLPQQNAMCVVRRRARAPKEHRRLLEELDSECCVWLLDGARQEAQLRQRAGKTRVGCVIKHGLACSYIEPTSEQMQKKNLKKKSGKAKRGWHRLHWQAHRTPARDNGAGSQKVRAIAKDGLRLNRHILVAVEVVARARMQLRPRVAPGMARAVAHFAKQATFAATNGSLRRGVTVDANLKHGVPTLVSCVHIAYAVPACSIGYTCPLFTHRYAARPSDKSGASLCHARLRLSSIRGLRPGRFRRSGFLVCGLSQHHVRATHSAAIVGGVSR